MPDDANPMSNGKDRGFQDAISGGQIFIPHQEPFDRTLVGREPDPFATLRAVAQHHAGATDAPDARTQVVGAFKGIGADADLVEGLGAEMVLNCPSDGGSRLRGRPNSMDQMEVKLFGW